MTRTLQPAIQTQLIQTDSNDKAHIFMQIGVWKTKWEHRPRQQTNLKGHIEFKDHKEQDYKLLFDM